MTEFVMKLRILLVTSILGCMVSIDGIVVPEAIGASTIHCPAGIKDTCRPRLVGTMALCTTGDVVGYRGISYYCLTCHAQTHQMSFAHPYETKYPEDEWFRGRKFLNEEIKLNGGLVTCKSCHAGSDPETHYLLGHSGLPSFCNHCHLQGIACPGETAQAESNCYPGRVYDMVRCLHGQEIVTFEHTSEFCIDCHSDVDMTIKIGPNYLGHPIEVEYPRNRSGFVALESLDPDIRLANSKITCETCHLNKALSVTLCRDCHIK